jgi:hypothetical protein
MIGTNNTKDSLKSLEMKNSTMSFHRTYPTNHTVILGLKENQSELAKNIFNNIENFLERKYLNRDWSQTTPDFELEFENLLIKEIIEPSLHNHGGFNDFCPHGKNCPLKTDSASKRKIWDIFRDRFKMIKKKVRSM